jgi:hypothetical protein
MSFRIHLIISALIAILFLVVIQLFASPLPEFKLLLPSYAGYLLVVAIYNRWYLKKTQEVWNVWVWLRLLFFLITWFGLFFLVPSGLGRGLFLLVSMPIIFFFESLVGNMGQQLGWNEFLLTCAGLLISLFGLSYYFIFAGVLYLALVFVTVAILVRSSFELIPHPPIVRWVAALSLGLFATELFWAISFLPLHYTALAIFMFNVLYVLWIIYYHYLYRTLTSKQIQFHLVLAIVLALVMLVSTPWSIQS